MSKHAVSKDPALLLSSSPFPIQLARIFIGVAHVVCPLLFFTNLTRNPYYTQIAILNILIALCIFLWSAQAWRSGEFPWPRFPFEWPLILFLGISLLSTGLSWVQHASVRAGVVNEGTRVWMFTMVNCVMVLYLPGIFTVPISEKSKLPSFFIDFILALLWGGLWFGYHSLKNPYPTSGIWDFYGGILWAGAILFAGLRSRRGEALAMFHLILLVGFLSGAYGILQYWGRDMIWASPVQPYGGRPVSTFGNPNFLSSYLMMVSPLAFAFALRSNGRSMVAYFIVAFVTAVGVLCTLTRSTYVGLLAAYAVMGLILFRRENLGWVKKVGIGTLAFVLLVLIFPNTPLSQIQSPLARFTEIFTAFKTGQPYGPWDQRILIWSCAWAMAKSNFLVGIGWGCFELFYPFYQGYFILIDQLSPWRTHANNAHNVLLEIWSQTGIVGTGMALWLLVTLVWGGWVLYRRQKESSKGVVIAALVAGVVGMIVDNFFGNVSIFFAVPAFLFWWNAGALFNEGLHPSVEVKFLKSNSVRLGIAVITVFSLVATIYFGKRWMQEVYYFEGFKQAKTNQVSTAYKTLEKAVHWFSGEVNTNYELGNGYSRMSHELAGKGLTDEARKFNEKAAQAYQLALDANPGYDEIYFNLGITLTQLGRKEEGIHALEVSKFINPLLRDAYGSLGNIFLNMGKLEEAAHVFEQATAVYPKDKDFWNNLGYTYSQMNNHEKSFEAYKKALLIDPGFQQAWHNFAIASKTLGRKDSLLEVPGLIQRMEAAVSQKNFAAALSPAKQIVDILPDHADSHLSLGNIYFYLRDYPKSEAEFRRAIEIKPDFIVAHTNLGRLFQIQGNSAAARQCFEAALRIDPNYGEAKRALAEISM